MALETWGKGKLNIKNIKKFYEQENLQLNILKSKKILTETKVFNKRKC